MRKTRLAPSPTGALHLGNARTFLINWALARQRGWRIVLRIDDLDGPRVRPGADRQAIDILRWLGIDWDEGPYYQTDRNAVYRATLQRLAAQGAIYPCRCTRTEIQAASRSAPHTTDHELRYPGTCRPARSSVTDFASPQDMPCAWRLRVEAGQQFVTDQVAGRCSFSVADEVGDFLVATKGGDASYQLAVVLDDLDQGITDIVRGADLLSSAARQQLIYQALGNHAIPDYWHLPLVVGSDGRRLAKRHGDTRVESYRALGVPAKRIIGLLASWSGLTTCEPLTSAEFASTFTLGQLPRSPIIFDKSHEAWLLGI